MLTLLIHWVPNLSAYPESLTAYFQLLTWMLHVTATVPEQLKNELGSTKKKASGGGSKLPPRGSMPQDDRLRASSGGSSSPAVDRADTLLQDVVAATAVGEMFDAVKMHNAVLADHLQGGNYQQLQVASLRPLYVCLWLNSACVWSGCHACNGARLHASCAC